MITVMRKHHKVLMIIITVLVCISFSWYWNKTDFAQMGDGTVGKIYDRNVSQVESSATCDSSGSAASSGCATSSWN